MKNRRYFILLFLLLSFYISWGQSHYVFHHLSTEDGLSNNHVKSILRDSYGFLWVGTQSGLSRYDGYDFKSYMSNPNVCNSLQGDNIIGLQEDKQGNIWILNDYNYAMYNRSKDTFITDLSGILQERGIHSSYISKIYIDSFGDIWMLHNGSLHYYCYLTQELKVFILPHQGDFTITDDGDKLYLMFQSGTLYELNIQKGAWMEIAFPNDIFAKIKGKDSKIYVDKEKNLWLYSDVNLYYKDVKNDNNWVNFHLQSGNPVEKRLISSILDNGNGKIWIATDHKDLFIYDKRSGKQTHLVHDPWIRTSILPGSIETLYQDEFGTVWMGCNKGLSYWNETLQVFLNYRDRDFSDISAIIEDYQGNIWLGTDGYGLVCKKKNIFGDKEQYNIPGNSVVTLFEDSKGRIWVGTYQNGLLCYEQGKMKQYTRQNSSLSDNSVWSIVEDRYGYLWIGTLWGTLQRIDIVSNQFENHLTVDNRHLTVMDMYYDGGDKLYAGTLYDGICQIDITTGRKTVHRGNYKGTQQYQQLLIQSLYKDQRNILWMGHNQGITAWDLKKDTLYYLNKNNGLCDNVVRGIGEDIFHHVWVTTSNGCSVIAVDQNKDESFSFSINNFSTRDGLMSNDFSRHAIYKLQNGDMLLGEAEGYSLVNPYKMYEKTKPVSKVIFTGLKIGNKDIKIDSLYEGRLILRRSMEQTTDLKLSYADRQISIEYATMDLLTTPKVRYAYKLEKFNSQWIHTPDNKITFSSLSSGEYRLLVKACNSDGVWNEEPAILKIVVTPPFWLSVYAYILYALLFVGAIILLWNRFQKKHQYRLEQQRLQLEREQSVRINEMKLKFFTNVSHDFRTPLTLIITPLQAMIDELQDTGIVKKLSFVYRNAEQLLNLVNELLDFRKLDVGAEVLRPVQDDFVLFVKEVSTAFHTYAAERHMDFSIVDEVEQLNMMFDTNKVRKILTNLLSNAFKYTPDKGRIVVRIFRQQEFIGVSVYDSGSGVPDEDKKHLFERFYQVAQHSDKTGSGIGLHIANEYVRLHGGTISVEDNTPQGSIFSFIIPIVKVEFKGENMMEDASLVDGNTEDEETPIDQCPTLLLVEDNKDFREFMSESLSGDYTVLTSNNGQEALDRLGENDINFVISDIMMPIMDGLELCKQIKTNINWSHIPVILLTARTTEEYKLQGLEYGADDYITKPFNLNMLKLRIRKFMEWTERSHQTFNQKIDVSPSEITITSLDEQLIAKAIKVVEEHMDDPKLSVETLSAAVGLTRGHLYKKLTYITGKGPLDFIKIIRLKRARQLLEESQLQIAEIAYAVGFNSPKIFAKNFRQEFGVLPSEYIKTRK